MDIPSVMFVCLGNICRSPMAEQVARHWAAQEGLTARIDSAGVSREELGNPMDPRAQRTLRAHDYPVGDHRAQQVTRAAIHATHLVIAAEGYHVERMQAMAPDATNLRLLTDFDPSARPGSGLPDPWFGGQDGFEETLAAIESAMPGILAALREFG